MQLCVVVSPCTYNSGCLIATNAITTGGPITFNGITPTIARQGATLWDIYLDAPNISSASQIYLTYPNSPTPVAKDSTSGQIKILVPLPASSTSTATATTPHPPTGAHPRLDAKHRPTP